MEYYETLTFLVAMWFTTSLLLCMLFPRAIFRDNVKDFVGILIWLPLVILIIFIFILVDAIFDGVKIMFTTFVKKLKKLFLDGVYE